MRYSASVYSASVFIVATAIGCCGYQAGNAAYTDTDATTDGSSTIQHLLEDDNYSALFPTDEYGTEPGVTVSNSNFKVDFRRGTENYDTLTSNRSLDDDIFVYIAEKVKDGEPETNQHRPSDIFNLFVPVLSNIKNDKCLKHSKLFLEQLQSFTLWATQSKW